MTRSKTRDKKQKTPLLIKVIMLIFLSLLFVLFTLIFSYMFVFPSLLKNVKSAENILFISDNLDGDTSSIYIIHLSSNEEENILSMLDGNTKIDVGDSYGKYDLKSVYNLLKIDKKDDQYIKSSFSKILKLSIDDVVTTKESLSESKSNQLKTTFLKTTTSKLSNLDFDFIKSLKYHYLVNTFEIEAYDSPSDFEKDLYKMSTLDTDVYQYCSVAVLNTTNENGLARDISELIENTGAMVVRTDGTDENLDKTMIYYSTQTVNCSSLVDSISGIFPTKPVIKHMDELDEKDQFRSGIVIKIGRN